MSFFAIYETATGRLESLGSVVADPLPPQFTSVDIINRPLDSEMWDEVTKAFITRPPKVLLDRLNDLTTRPAFLTFWNGLNVTQKQQLRDGVIWLLGRARWRHQNGSAVVEPETP